jgi:hypothetical protein
MFFDGRVPDRRGYVLGIFSASLLLCGSPVANMTEGTRLAGAERYLAHSFTTLATPCRVVEVDALPLSANVAHGNWRWP